jgi:hypothetical protein
MPLARCLPVMTTRRRSPSSISLSDLWTTTCMVRGSIARTIARRLPGGYAERNLKLALEYGWMVEIQFLLTNVIRPLALHQNSKLSSTILLHFFIPNVLKYNF